ETCLSATEILATNRDDIPFALLYLLNEDGKSAHLVGNMGLKAGMVASPLVVEVEEQDMQWPLGSVLQTGKAVKVDDIPQRFGSLTEWLGQEAVHSALLLPVARSGQESLYGLLVVGISPRRVLDDEYLGFFELVAGQIAANIAHVRAYQEERERAEALAKLDAAKTMFFSNVSHEFRTPLTLLLSPSEEALNDRERPLPIEQRERLEIIRRNGLRLLKLVNTLLDFSRIEAGRMQVVYELTDLSAFTREITNTFRAVVEHAGLELVIQTEVLSEPAYVDRDMWEKILLNLLSNAFKFTFEGGISVELRQVGSIAELVVQDTGIGIAEEDLPRIFERFERFRGMRARTFEGSGIGLALVQELVTRHGGSIRVSSRVGEGTAFTITLPLGSAHLPPECIREGELTPASVTGFTPYVEEVWRWLPDETDITPASEVAWMERSDAYGESGVAAAMKPGRAGAHILLVDDNADMREYLKRLLSQQYKVEAVADGESAFARARESIPDLILSDVMMPGLDGMQFVQALRNDSRTQMIPVILLSARAGTEATVEGLVAGADDYLVKPFSARELLARVGTRLEMVHMRMGMTEKEREHAERLQRLAQASLGINSMRSINELLALITVQAREIIGAHLAVASMTIDANGAQSIASHAFSEKYAEWEDYEAFPDGSGIYQIVCRTNQPMRMTQEELEAHPAWNKYGKEAGKHPPLRGWLVVPLVGRNGDNLGLLQLSDRYTGEFNEEDEAILVQLAQIASIAIENAQLYRQAQEAINARDELLSMVSHDLKNPLGAIKGYAQLLQRGLADREEPDRARLLMGLTRINATANRMTGQINDLLDFAQMHVGQPLELVRQEVDLVALTKQVIMEQQQTSQRHKIRLETTESELKGYFDNSRLERVVSNLLSNAIKYSPKGQEIDVRIRCEESEGVDWAVLTIEDRGIGIPASDLPHIFEQFKRAENVIGKIKGSGIGLASARKILELHGGTIGVSSQEGQGSTFTVKLPLTS
ncbi:MAG: response regulator, partial [Ktedonobacteraceae bacterium]|nr:response regulator [Ktedonobacteraceae bacterium]